MFIPARAFGANDRIVIGGIGVGKQGSGLVRSFAKLGQMGAISDVYLPRAEHIAKEVGADSVHQDYRGLLDRKDIDAVIVATPHHWHVKIAIEALQAGKHVFCQKPLSLTLEENQLARAAAEKFPNLQFFIGTQQRSQRDLFLRAVNMVHKGLLGDITKVTVGINGSPTGGPFPVENPPKELDWEMWLGQAPKVDYRAKWCHYQYRW